MASLIYAQIGAVSDWLAALGDGLGQGLGGRVLPRRLYGLAVTIWNLLVKSVHRTLHLSVVWGEGRKDRVYFWVLPGRGPVPQNLAGGAQLPTGLNLAAISPSDYILSPDWWGNRELLGGSALILPAAAVQEEGARFSCSSARREAWSCSLHQLAISLHVKFDSPMLLSFGSGMAGYCFLVLFAETAREAPELVFLCCKDGSFSLFSMEPGISLSDGAWVSGLANGQSAVLCPWASPLMWWVGEDVRGSCLAFLCCRWCFSLGGICFLACSFVYVKSSWKGAALSSRASKRNINTWKQQVEKKYGHVLRPEATRLLLHWFALLGEEASLEGEDDLPSPTAALSPLAASPSAPSVHTSRQLPRHTPGFPNPVRCGPRGLDPTDLVRIQHRSFLHCFYHHLSET